MKTYTYTMEDTRGNNKETKYTSQQLNITDALQEAKSDNEHMIITSISEAS